MNNQQIIQVKTEIWSDNRHQLHINKTIRQMRRMTEGNWYEFEDVVRIEHEFSNDQLEELLALPDGLYIMHCYFSDPCLEYGEIAVSEYTFEKYEK